jgi:hypothetical protein
MSDTRSNLVDLTLQLVQQTERAILVSEDGDPDKAVWLPKSQVEFEEVRPGIADVTLPEWLATERGLV